jgi:uncharacterized damage-inducible protein DinB
MTWTAPQIDRPHEPYIADERTMLEGWLEWHRHTLLVKCTGLTAQQLKQASVPPSKLTLLGLVRHLAEVERWWFRRFTGTNVEDIYCTDDDPDGDFDNVADANAEADLDTFLAEIAAAREAVAGEPLDRVYPHPEGHHDRSLRWIYTHMIEEYARHNGHADLLRERIDGVVGD